LHGPLVVEWIPRYLNNDSRARMRWILRIRQKDVRLVWVFPWVTAERVTYDSDDLSGNDRLCGVFELWNQIVANRILIGKVLAHKGVIDDGHPRRGREIVVLDEGAPTHQGDG